MASSALAEIATTLSSSQLKGIIAAVETKLDEFNGKVEGYLFSKISETEFSEIIGENPELAKRLQLLMDDEVALRVKSRQLDSLLEDILKLDIEIDEKILQVEKKAKERRQSLLIKKGDQFKIHSKLIQNG